MHIQFKLKLSIITCAIGTFFGFLIFGFGLSWHEKGLASQDAAGWMQAFGSIASIALGIFALYKQRADIVTAEDAQVRHLLYCLADEIATITERSQNNMGSKLLNTSNESYFEWKLPINDEPFPIFYSCRSEIPKIKDGAIRQRIIVTYTLLQSAIMSIRMNNELLEHMQFAAESYRKSNDSRDKVILDASLQCLHEYLAPLKKVYLDAIESSQELVETVKKMRENEE